MRSSARLRYMRWGDWSPAVPVQASTSRSGPSRDRSVSRTSCQKSALMDEPPSTSWEGHATLIAVAISSPSPFQKKRTSTP